MQPEAAPQIPDPRISDIGPKHRADHHTLYKTYLFSSDVRDHRSSPDIDVTNPSVELPVTFLQYPTTVVVVLQHCESRPRVVFCVHLLSAIAVHLVVKIRIVDLWFLRCLPIARKRCSCHVGFVLEVCETKICPCGILLWQFLNTFNTDPSGHT